MSHPLVVMDPQVSLKQYLREYGLPEPGPFALIDEDDTVRLAAKAMGHELPPEACYLEQLWLRVDPDNEISTPPDQGGGAPAWVPVDAKIHIDFLGGAPQGRAWVAGTGEVAVDTLLGSDPLSVASYGNTGYSPVYLIPDGYPGIGGSVPAFLGVAKSMLLASATMALQFKNFTTVASPVSLLYMGAENGDDLIAAEAMVASTKKVRISSVAGFNFSTTNLVDTTIAAVNKIALTVAALRMEIALNGGAAVGGAMTTADRPPGNPFVFALFDMQASAAQSITIYDPLPSTAGLSELSGVDITEGRRT